MFLIVKNRFKNGALDLKKIINLAIPISLGQFVQLSMHMIDAAMIGRLGVRYFATAALIGNFFNFFLIFSLGIATSIRVLISGNFSKKNQIFGYAAFCASIYSLFVVVLTPLIYNLLLKFNFFSPLPNNEDLIYLKFLVWAFFLTVGFVLIKTYFETIYRPYVVLIALIAMLILSCFFNWVLVFGNLGFPSFGIKGAGISAVISRVLVLSFLLSYGFYLRIFSVKDFLKNMYNKMNAQFIAKPFWKISIYSSLQQMLGWGSFIFLTFLAGTLGTDAIAVHQIVSFCSSLPYMFILGFSFAVTILVGEAMEKKDVSLVRLLARHLHFFALFFAGIFYLVYLVFYREIPCLFVKDIAVVSKASLLLIVLGFYLFFLSFQITTLAVLRGMQDVKIPTIFALIGFWGIGVGSACFFVYILHLNVLGIWIGLILGMGGAAFLFMKRFYNLLWQQQLQ